MRLCVPIALAGLALCGCGGAGDRDTAVPAAENGIAEAAAPPACSVVSEEDAERTFGRDARRLPNEGGPSGLDICQYGYEGEQLMDTGNLSVTVQPVDLASLRRGLEEQGFSVEPVEGIGDQAFWSNEAGLYVGKGGRSAIYLVGIGGAGESDNKAKAFELARATVGKL